MPLIELKVPRRGVAAVHIYLYTAGAWLFARAGHMYCAA